MENQWIRSNVDRPRFFFYLIKSTNSILKSTRFECIKASTYITFFYVLWLLRTCRKLYLMNLEITKLLAFITFAPSYYKNDAACIIWPYEILTAPVCSLQVTQYGTGSQVKRKGSTKYVTSRWRKKSSRHKQLVGGISVFYHRIYLHCLYSSLHIYILSKFKKMTNESHRAKLIKPFFGIVL